MPRTRSAPSRPTIREVRRIGATSSLSKYPLSISVTSARPVVAVATANISETGSWNAAYPCPCRNGVVLGKVFSTCPMLTARKNSGMNSVGMVASG